MSDRFYILLGWWLFVACAGFFLASAWLSGDLLALFGSALFMVANISFLIPMYRRNEERRHD